MNLRSAILFKWMRRVIIIVVSMYVVHDSYCQSIARWVITPFSNAYDNNFQNVQSTLGEPVIMTVTDSASFFLTQGFQQPNQSELPDSFYTITIKIYPNPVINQCSVAFYVKDEKDFTIDVWDIVGNIIYKLKLTEVYSGQIEKIDFGKVTQGIYLIHVYSDTNQMQFVEKIVKL